MSKNMSNSISRETVSHWAMGMVIVGAVAALASRRPQISSIDEIEIFCTFITGFWFARRYRYTEKTAPGGGTISWIFAGLIAVCGLMCFVLAGSRDWFLAHSLVLFSATFKDIEVALRQRSIVTNSTADRSTIWKAKWIGLHHLYAVVRDISMSLWWLIYGTEYLWAGADRNRSAALFTVPYILLVLIWAIMKDVTESTELDLRTKR